MAGREWSGKGLPECFGQAQCHGCLWRAECVEATLGRPPDRRYGPKKHKGGSDAVSGHHGTSAGK